MRTLSILCVLLSFAGPVLAEGDRDATRKAILEEELATEARHFAEAHAELGATRRAQTSAERLAEIAERVDRHRRNIAALTRELSRGGADMPTRSVPSKAVSNEWLIPPSGNRQRPEWLVPGGQQGR